MKKTNKSRRKFLQKCVATNLFLLGDTWMVSSCGSNTSESGGSGSDEKEAYVGDPCNDMTGVSQEELAKRKKAWVAPAPLAARGYVRFYIEHVQQAHLGTDLDILRGGSGSEVTRDLH